MWIFELWSLNLASALLNDTTSWWIRWQILFSTDNKTLWRGCRVKNRGLNEETQDCSSSFTDINFTWCSLILQWLHFKPTKNVEVNVKNTLYLGIRNAKSKTWLINPKIHHRIVPAPFLRHNQSPEGAVLCLCMFSHFFISIHMVVNNIWWDFFGVCASYCTCSILTCLYTYCYLLKIFKIFYVSEHVHVCLGACVSVCVRMYIYMEVRGQSKVLFLIE